MQCATADPDGRKRALLIGGGIANFTDVAATFNGTTQSKILANILFSLSQPQPLATFVSTSP
jgi:hypothetical protein